MFTHDFRKLQLFRRNYEWLVADFPMLTKIRYYPALLASYFRLLIHGQKYIMYFGNRFYYDNVATPLNLQNYPYEVSHKILRNVTGDIHTVLDVGGNIGQFPVTFDKLVPGIVRIDALEPNPAIFALLQKNVQQTPKVKIFNYGLAKKGDLAFFYEEGRSATGSFIKENASDRQTALIKLSVQTTDNVARLTKHSSYDLITVDVEGYENEVIRLLTGITTRYLYLEASGAGRKKEYKHSGLFEQIKNQLGAFDIVYQSELTGPMTTIEYLLYFRNKHYS